MISITAADGRLLVAAYGPLDAGSVEVFQQVVADAIEQSEGADLVEIDVRCVPSISPEGLALIARLVERGVRLWADELQIDARPVCGDVRCTGTGVT
jgi:hypothetical protein